MEINFCRRCGSSLSQDGSRWVCQNNHSTYKNPLPAAAVFFIDGENIIVARRAIDPGKGMLDAIGGFIEPQESAEQAVIREIKEETGLSPQDYGPLHSYCTAPTLYEFEGEQRDVLSTFYWAELKADAQLIAKDDVAEIISLPLSQIDITEFSGSDVRVALRELLRMFAEVS